MLENSLATFFAPRPLHDIDVAYSPNHSQK